MYNAEICNFLFLTFMYFVRLNNVKQCGRLRMILTKTSICLCRRTVTVLYMFHIQTSHRFVAAWDFIFVCFYLFFYSEKTQRKIYLRRLHLFIKVRGLSEKTTKHFSGNRIDPSLIGCSISPTSGKSTGFGNTASACGVFPPVAVPFCANSSFSSSTS